MTNMQKHSKQTLEQADQADAGTVGTGAHASQMLGTSAGNSRHLPAAGDRGAPFLIRLEDLDANPANVDGMRERIRILNQHLAQSGAPFRLRLV